MLLTEKRKARILELHRAGSSPYDIANHHGLRVGAVRVFLRAMGEEITEYDRSVPIDRDSIWSLPDDERRIAFAERARQGAKQTLDAHAVNELAQFPPLSTLVTDSRGNLPVEVEEVRGGPMRA